MALTHAEAVALLGGAAGSRPGLERTRHLLGALGDPQRGLRGVLVAGTNGKGSVCALIDSICRTAGLRTALLTNPHLRSYRERIVIDGRMLGRPEFAALIEEVHAAAATVADRDGAASQFEMLTAAGILAAARAGSEVVVCEVGLGGRLDSTNILDLGMAVITNVSLEHVEVLGSTVEAIAAEKAGIIKAGNEVVTAAGGGALEVIRRRARDVGATLLVAGDDHPYRGRSLGRAGVEIELGDGDHLGRRFRAPLPGGHQIANTAVALIVCDRLRRRGLPIDGEVMGRGAASVRWPGRMEWRPGHPALLLDGAHNPAGMEACVTAAAELCGARPVVALVAVMADKDVAPMVAALRRLTSTAVLTRVADPRALGVEDLSRLWGEGGRPAGSVPEGLRLARRLAGRHGVVLVCGSLYLVGEVLDRLAIRRLRAERPASP